MNNLKKIKKLENNFDIIGFSASIADIMLPIKYSPNQKYDYKYLFACLYDFINTSTSWNKYRGFENFPINGKYLNQIHNKLVNNGVYEEINRQLLNIYLKKGKEIKLKYQMIDSSFIRNKVGSIKNNNHLLSDQVKEKNKIIEEENKIIDKENKIIDEINKNKSNRNDQLPHKRKKKKETFIDHNRYNGRKKYFKVSTITDSVGTPLVSTIISSKQSDSISITETINKIPIELNTLKNSKINRYKQYFLADAGYDSKKNKLYLKKIGYTPIIAYNKKNQKNKKIIELNKLKGKELKIYKKRNIVESFFSWIKNYAIINQNYQKTIKSYNGLLLSASSILISKRININFSLKA